MPKIKVFKSDDEKDESWVTATTNSDGKYVLPFFWDPLQLASVLAVANCRIRAFANTDNDSDRVRTNGHLSLDLRKLFGQVFPTFDSPTQEAFDCAQAFILSFHKVAQLPPHHKLLISAEVWGILGKANFFVLTPPKK